MTDKKKSYRESELPMLLQSMASIGIVVVLSIAAFFYIGYLLDQYLGLGVTGMVVSTFLGAFVGIYWAYRRVTKVLQKLFQEKEGDSADQHAAMQENAGQEDK